VKTPVWRWGTRATADGVESVVEGTISQDDYDEMKVKLVLYEHAIGQLKAEIARLKRQLGDASGEP